MFHRGPQCPSEGVRIVNTCSSDVPPPTRTLIRLGIHGVHEWPWNLPSVAMFTLTRVHDRRMAWLNQFQ